MIISDKVCPHHLERKALRARNSRDWQQLIEMCRVVDTVLIDQDETRDLARRDSANLAKAHLRHHPLEAGALDPARSGTAKIIINHLDLQPAELSQAIAHGILQRVALVIVQNLMSRRLPHIEKARHGELVVSAPVGFVKAGDHYEKDPNQRVQEAISLVFDKVLEQISARLDRDSQPGGIDSDSGGRINAEAMLLRPIFCVRRGKTRFPRQTHPASSGR